MPVPSPSTAIPPSTASASSRSSALEENSPLRWALCSLTFNDSYPLRRLISSASLPPIIPNTFGYTLYSTRPGHCRGDWQSPKYRTSASAPGTNWPGEACAMNLRRALWSQGGIQEITPELDRPAKAGVVHARLPPTWQCAGTSTESVFVRVHPVSTRTRSQGSRSLSVRRTWPRPRRSATTAK